MDHVLDNHKLSNDFLEKRRHGQILGVTIFRHAPRES